MKVMVNSCKKMHVNPKVVDQLKKSRVLSWLSRVHRWFQWELSVVEVIVTRQNWSALSVCGRAWAMGWPGSLEFKFKSYIDTHTQCGPSPPSVSHNNKRSIIKIEPICALTHPSAPCSIPYTPPGEGKSDPSIMAKTWMCLYSPFLTTTARERQSGRGGGIGGGREKERGREDNSTLICLCLSFHYFPVVVQQGERIPEKRVTALL